MTEIQTLLVLPAVLMVFLTFTILFSLGFKRFKAAKNREVDPKYYKLYQNGTEPESCRKFARNYENLFEIPLLFYIGIILTLVLKLECWSMVYVAWAYAVLRILHSYIHCSTNKVLWRFRIFVLSSLVLMAYWIILAVKILA
ncbi:hypothetical protein FLL45_08655 [Aliikangiella marina]|uniref:MAPEG family protein n=1 Tax=Aliikangiella marina TaxID=1712262 RepID=A0A545TCQ3_9GAMM|nr:MAPEG family protein [Aliikangiella marina]TQV75002.1 hypothetical protein FLL45_08655 [Aliikangiella marina]